jgi:hypothetical protein
MPAALSPDAWSKLVFRAPRPEEPHGHPHMLATFDPARAIADLAHASRVSTLSIDVSPAPFGDEIGDHRAEKHVQGVTVLYAHDGTRCLAISRSFIRKGVVVFAREQAGRFRYVRHLRTALDHPSGLQAWGSIVAIASEASDSNLVGRVTLYDDPVSTAASAPLDELVLDGSHGEPIEGRSKAGWCAFTRLVDGRYLLLIGGNDFGRDIGWFFFWDASAAQGSRFSFLAAYESAGATATVQGGFGYTHNAAFVSAKDGRLFLVALGTIKKNAGIARVRVFELLKGEAPCALKLVRRGLSEIKPVGGVTFRAGATAHVRSDEKLTLYVTGRNAELLRNRLRISRYEPL